MRTPLRVSAWAVGAVALTVSRDGERMGARSITAPGARVDVDGAEGTADAAALLTIDQPGLLTVTALVADRDPALDPGDTGADTECTHMVSATFDILAPTATKVGKLRRPRLIDRPRNLAPGAEGLREGDRRRRGGAWLSRPDGLRARPDRLLLA